MPKQRLTDRQLISGVTLTDLLHFVVTGDTSQSPAGSSYKGSVEQLFNGFSSYTCSTPLLLDTVNACTSAITINGNVIINGSATTINTEVIQSKDNNIVLNYSGTHLTAIGGGITLEDGVSNGVDSRIYTDSNGTWLFDPGLSASTGTILNFTADTISVNTIGNSGDCVNDIYVTNIHSCSPLNINPLDEGNIYFGSTSGITIDLTNNRVGIGTNNPSERLEVSGNTKISEDLFVGDTIYVGNVTGTPTTNASLYIRQPSITGSTESPIIEVKVSDSDSYLRVNNDTMTDGFFTPTLTSRQANSPDRLSFVIDSIVDPTYDTPGAIDVMRFRARRDSDFIQNRDLFSWYNYTTRLLDLDKDGNLDIIQGGLRIGTLGTGTSINNLGIDSSGNVVSGVTGNLLYTQTNNYTLGVPITINHNLNTTDVLVQVVDTNTNELIYGTVDNYQSNSLDVTLSTTINNIKVLVIGSPVSQVTPKGTIVYTLGHDSISPTDNNDYFIGQNFNLTPSTSSNDSRRFIVQKTGVVTQLSIKRTITGTLGSNETNSFYINNVTQITQTLVTSGETFDASSSLNNYILSTPLNVTAGDKLEIEWFTPAWVTNPTAVRETFNMIIEY
jgi:hypothetical protein